MIVAEGVVVARTLGEARMVIDRLELTNWVPASPTRPVKGVKVVGRVIVLDNFDVPDPVWRSIYLAAGTEKVSRASVVFHD